MRALVVRPEPAASETAARLRARGHEALPTPVTRLAVRPEPAGMPDPAALLLTSRNALAALAQWPVAGSWRALPVLAVGDRTAEAARAAGFADVRASAGGVADLAEFVARSLPADVGPLLYPAAADRAGDLGGMLRRHGFAVHLVEAYGMEPVDRLDAAAAAALGGGTVDAVLLYSRRTAAIFARLVEDGGLRRAFGTVAVHALSEAVAAGLGTLRPAAMRVAPRPDEEALLALLDISDG